MKLNIFDLLLPRETKFYGFLIEHTSALLECATALKELVRDIEGLAPTELKEKVNRINLIEKKGDAVEMKIIQELNNTFITPFDREDIHAMTMSIDRAMDIMNALSNKIDIYGMSRMPQNVLNFINLILEISNELKLLISKLEKRDGVEETIANIHTVENKADYLFHISMAELFQNSKDPIEVIKLKEVYELLEEVVDAVDYVGKIVRRITIKQG
jgi:hypothetical protein